MKKALMWKLLERFGVQGVQFVLQIILARILDPAHYGALSLMVIFTTLANVFVQSGFSTALIQNKDVTEDDYSSVFWVSLLVAVILYVVLFIASPFIASFFRVPEIVAPFRVLALMLIPGAFNSVQLAKVSREMDFRKVFFSNVGGIIVSGLVGIVIAYMGGGLWALVAQTLLNITVACIVMLFTVNWKPRLVLELSRIKVLFSYGWKLLVSTLIDTLYQDLQSLVIGRKYDSETLAFFNRGKQFPQFIISAINGAVQSVMLPAMSRKQDTKEDVKKLMRRSITLSAFVVFPMMAGLAGVAEPMVKVLLTDKWLPCVPYLRIFCINYAFWPVHTCNLQAINATGRSDIFLKLEIIKKTYGVIALMIALMCFDSPLVIAATGLITTFISCFVNAFPNKKLIDYSFREQAKDLLPSLFAATVMFAVVISIGELTLPPLALLILQIIVGVVVYVAIVALTKNEAFRTCLDIIKTRLPENWEDNK